MKGRRVQKVLAAVLAVAMVLPMPAIPAKAEEAEEVTYKLYPNPQEMTYQDGSYILKKNVNVIYDVDIDDATKARLEETAELKCLNVTESDAEKSGATNIYVGVYGSDGTVDDQIVDEYAVDTSLFDHTDSYFLKSDNNTIAELGKDTDASFYGLTTLYHVLAQTESLSIRNFTIEDYADVVSRGFIEGYYGNPWSTEDRVNLMTWGGYYKLNAYFYAPKDDPKHRANWDELYTDEELESKIRPLAAEVDLIPRVHGSAMFTRGQTQICDVVTLAPLSEVQKIDGLDENVTTKRYMHQYIFFFFFFCLFLFC